MVNRLKILNNPKESNIKHFGITLFIYFVKSRRLPPYIKFACDADDVRCECIFQTMRMKPVDFPRLTRRRSFTVT